MIYAIILIAIGLIAILFNHQNAKKRTIKIKAWLAPLFIIWGTVGIVILNTIRFGVFHENTAYWFLLIFGSMIEVVIGSFFIYRLLQFKNKPQFDYNLILPQTILGIASIVVGIATLIVK